MEASEWISIQDGCPEESGLVLTCMQTTKDIYISFYRPQRNSFEVWGAGRDPITDMKVTHWQPLPGPPKQ